MKNHISTFILFIIGSAYCCNSISKKSFSSVDFQNKSLPVNLYLNNNYNPALFKYYFDEQNKAEYFVWYNEKDSSIDFSNVNDTIVTHSIKMHKLLTKFSDFAPYSLDSIIIFNYPKNFNVISSNGEYFYEVTDSIPDYHNHFDLNTLALYPLTIIDKDIFVYNFPDEVLDNPNKLQKYFSTPRDTRLTILNNNIKISGLYGNYPDYYKNNSNYVYSPVRTVGENAKLIYSFDDIEDIFIYDIHSGKYETKKLEVPFFKKNQVFDQSKSTDFNYISKYYTENDRFVNMIYDKYRNLYYRILSKSIKYENNDGTINRAQDKPFSILIYDNHFNFIKEITFPSRKYNFTTIYVTKDNVKMFTSNEYEIKNRQIHAYTFN